MTPKGLQAIREGADRFVLTTAEVLALLDLIETLAGPLETWLMTDRFSARDYMRAKKAARAALDKYRRFGE